MEIICWKTGTFTSNVMTTSSKSRLTVCSRLIVFVFYLLYGVMASTINHFPYGGEGERRDNATSLKLKDSYKIYK